MKTLLFAAGLLASSSLAGCSKKDDDRTMAPAPATPTLTAKWQVDSTWASGGTAATLHTKTGLKTYAAGLITVDITSDTYIIYVNGVEESRYIYKLVGQEMKPSPGGSLYDIYNTHTVKELTAKRLVITTPIPQGNGQFNPYAVSVITYSR